MEENTIIDLTKEKYIRVAPSMTREEFETAISDGTHIKGFIGWVETTKTKSNALVPDTFPNYNKPLMEDYDEEVTTTTINEDGEEVVMVAKTFREYVGGLFREGVATTSTKCMIPVGYRNAHGNRHSHVTDEELRLWVSHFTLAKIKTKSEAHTLLKSSVYLSQESEI